MNPAIVAQMIKMQAASSGHRRREEFMAELKHFHSTTGGSPRTKDRLKDEARCPECGNADLTDINGRWFCDECNKYV
jgi:ribosomal protein S27AE